MAGMRTFFRCLTCLFVWQLAALGADEFPFEPPKNFTLSPKYIALHHPVQTTQSAAQLFFDQGLTFTYAFNHDAAYWSFLRASESDPNMAMAYWGMALVLGTNININITPKRAKVALEALRKATQLATNGPENERAYITALSRRYSYDPNADAAKLATAYSQAMEELVKKYPDDPDACVLYAESLLDIAPWKQWSRDGTPSAGTFKALDALESVLKRDPQHLGANHYYIHTIEASPYPERGLISAERLKHLLPSSGHILHMPSHIYLLVGDYQKAALANEEAVAADREYIREYGLAGIYAVHYLSHNLHFLSQAYAMQGRFIEAKHAADELSALYLPHYIRMPELEMYASTAMFVRLRFHKWKEIIALPKPSQEMHTTTTLWHFARSIALANLDNMTQAMEEKRLFLQAKTTVAEGKNYGNNSSKTIFALAEHFLDAKLAQSQGQTDKAIEFLQRAIALQDALNYDEPPDWLFSIRITLGGILLKTNQYAAAEQEFRADLKRHPRNGLALFGLKQSLAAQAKGVDNYWVNKEFQAAWKNSGIALNTDAL